MRKNKLAELVKNKQAKHKSSDAMRKTDRSRIACYITHRVKLHPDDEAAIGALKKDLIKRLGNDASGIITQIDTSVGVMETERVGLLLAQEIDADTYIVTFSIKHPNDQFDRVVAWEKANGRAIAGKCGEVPYKFQAKFEKFKERAARFFANKKPLAEPTVAAEPVVEETPKKKSGGCCGGRCHN